MACSTSRSRSLSSASRGGSRSPRTGTASRPRSKEPQPGPRLGRIAELFEIGARAGTARAGVLHLAHGDVKTPAFVPLASHATVRSLQGAEVAELGYEM